MISKLLVVIYDGIQNSVFHSQVLTPIIKLLNNHKNSTVTLISFEQKHLPKKFLSKIEQSHDRLQIIVRKKLPFFGRPSLFLPVFYLTRLFKQKKHSKILARGPLAGWIVQKTFDRLKHENVHLTIQARGLAAEEFRYTTEKSARKTLKSRVRFLFRKRFYNSYKKIEQEVYGKKSDFLIEAVSPKLKDYLVDNFGADIQKITIAEHDKPPPVDKIQVKKWRYDTRDELKIPHNKYVYCYAGSAQPWQCVDQMIDYASKKISTDKNAFFLFLSRDKKLFEKKLQAAQVQSHFYRVCSVHPSNIYRYLSAADAGLLFREDDPVNLVARPTKLLEYEAVGLTPFIHLVKKL
jgi:hypothetical protein